MNISRILLSGLAATTAMTLFSYAISEKKKKNFREPEVLGKGIKRLHTGADKTTAKAAGWLLHYGVGILFTGMYELLWNRKTVKPSLASGAVLGAISGLAGIAVWQTSFSLHPHPPVKHLKSYYRHLFFAHIIFGITAAETYVLSGKQQRS